MKVRALQTKHIMLSGESYLINNTSIYDFKPSIAYYFSANGWVEIIEEDNPTKVNPYEIWGNPKTSDRPLKKYYGDKIHLCINATDEVIDSGYDQTVIMGKYRFYGGDWNSQIQKRNAYLREDRINVIVDTDEIITGKLSLPKKADVGWVKVTNNGQGERWQPRVFRGIEGMHYLKRHHWIFDGNGDLIASHNKEGDKYKHVKLNVSLDNAQDSKFDKEGSIKRNEYRTHIFNKELCHPESQHSNLYICHINNEDMAGLSARLSDALNKYTRHSSISFRSIENYLGFKGDKSTDDPNFKRAVQTADILVFNETYPIGKIHYKPTIMIHHGSWYRSHPSLIEEDKVADAVFGTTFDLLEADPRMMWLPSPVDVAYLEKFKSETKRFTVCHSTTSRAKRKTEEIIKAVPEVKIIEGLSHKESLKKRGKYSVFIDHLANLGYGVGALEAMAMGKPVIVGMNDYAIKKCLGIVGYLPVIPVKKPEQIAEVVDWLKDKDVYEYYSKLGYQYVKEWHDLPVCAKRFEDICFKVLKGKIC